MSYNTAATFYPGGDDSYYMPEIVQPAPHRVTELPTNMQQNVAQMEHAVQHKDGRNALAINGSPRPDGTGWAPPHSSSFDTQPPAPVFNQPQTYQQPQVYQQPQFASGLPEQPNFSPFPVVPHPPPNVPPTDEQKEATLERAREAVLASNDPETQLVWAQDALAYVEVSQLNEQRVSATQPARSRTPRIEHQLREDAMKIVNFLADQHHPKAEFLRGMWLEFGKFGHRTDKKEAFHCYSRASEGGYQRANYRIGMQFESSNDALKAIKYYQRGADANDSASSYRLGMMTLLGQHGQQQDFDRGLRLIFSSAQTADENAPQGAYVLGMLQAGELPQVTVPERFLPRDIAAAKVNIEKAAYLGFAKAQTKMGSAYELCELDCPFDPAMSLHYNALAARQGEAEAEMSISKWFLCGHEGVFEKNEEMAFTYAQRAAVAGLATAQFAMGYFYEVGIYVPVDFNTAKEWYRKSSQNGNPDAGGRIDAISRSKTLSRKDHESIALKRIRQQYGSANQGGHPMPSVPEISHPPSIDMPDPSRLTLSSTPARPASTTPYPVGPPSMPSVNAGPEFRPNSAFGINPNLRASSTAPVMDGRRYYTGDGGMAPPQPRPYSSVEPGYGNYGPGRRLPSGPPPPGHGLPSQAYAPQRPSTTSPYLHPQGNGLPAPPVPSKADLGYMAPPDPSGADRKQRPSYGVDPSGGRPRPPVPQHGSNPPRTSSRPVPQGQPSASYSGKQDRPTGSGYSQGRPPVTQYQPAPNIKPSGGTGKLSKPGPTSSSRPPKPNTVAPSAASRPEKGPKSFDEMGIPRVKDKGDCVVM